MYHKGAIESYPLQVYASALLFSPTGSLIRQLFQHEVPEGMTIKLGMRDSWSACLQTLESYNGSVNSVAFSHNLAQLASALGDNTVKIWVASSSACLHTLEGYSNYVTSVAFSPDSTRLVLALNDQTVKIWDASSGPYLHTLEGHSGYVKLVASSHNSYQLASALTDKTVKIWDASSGACESGCR
jgi:WD40 repeat protein